MKATFNSTVLAEANKEDLIYIEGNWYFPPATVKKELLKSSATPYTCPWKGVCTFYNVEIDGQQATDCSWSYDHPLPTAIDQVKKDFSGYVAFYRDIVVGE
jgi:uncharacterized protein (DUF427 family)